MLIKQNFIILILSYIVYGLLAIFIMSFFGPHYFSIGGLYIPEIPVIIILLFLLIIHPAHLHELYRILYRFQFIFIISIIFILMVIGYLFNGDIAGSYTDFRAIAALVVTFYIARDIKLHYYIERFFIYTCLFNVVFDTWISLTRNIDANKGAYNIFADIILLSYYSRKGNIFGYIIIFSTIFIQAVFSNYRSYWIITIIACILYFAVLLYKCQQRRNGLIQVFTIFFAICGITTLFFYNINNILTNVPGSSVQTIGKFNDLLKIYSGVSLGGESDQVHYQAFLAACLHPEIFLMPHGLGYKADMAVPKQPISDYKMYILANTIDCGYYYLAYHFGLFGYVFLAYLFIAFLHKLIFTNIKKVYNFVISVIIISIYLLFTGNLFSVIPIAIMAGGYAGLSYASILQE